MAFGRGILLSALWLISGVCQAGGMIYVDANRPDDSGDGFSWDTAKATIQGGIDIASDGDVVMVAEGHYRGNGNYDLDCRGLGITIRSVEPNDSKVIAKTVIDANGQGRGFYIHSGEDSNCVITGFTISKGQASGKGGGMFCYASSPTVRNCVFSNNSAGLHGGGLFFQWSSSRVEGCVVVGNTAVLDGGGIECLSADILLENCVVAGNEATGGNGGGVDCYDTGEVAVNRCVFAGNSAYAGGGIYFLATSGAVQDSIFWGNDAVSDGSEIAIEEYYGSVSEMDVNYSDVDGGEPGIYVGSGCSLGWGNGNMVVDPCFVSFDFGSDVNDWDFHLQSEYGRWDEDGETWVTDANTSRCIDGGAPDAGWGEERWPNGKRLNMGAYAGTGRASMSGNPADFNVDGKVDGIDFALLGQEWDMEGDYIVDLDLDEKVGFGDMRIFSEQWLWRRP